MDQQRLLSYLIKIIEFLGFRICNIIGGFIVYVLGYKSRMPICLFKQNNVADLLCPTLVWRDHEKQTFRIYIRKHRLITNVIDLDSYCKQYRVEINVLLILYYPFRSLKYYLHSAIQNFIFCFVSR